MNIRPITHPGFLDRSLMRGNTHKATVTKVTAEPTPADYFTDRISINKGAPGDEIPSVEFQSQSVEESLRFAGMMYRWNASLKSERAFVGMFHQYGIKPGNQLTTGRQTFEFWGPLATMPSKEELLSFDQTMDIKA